MTVLVGTSSTGKTRACWEAIQALADDGWRLWHPFDPTRAEAALDDLERVRPYTVVWLNEVQHYLGHLQLGERIAAGLHSLLTDARCQPVLILGTLWPEYHRQYTALPEYPGGPDPHSRARELLAGRTLVVPEHFDHAALRRAADLAEKGDQLLAGSLTRAAVDGRVTQDLAGAPELLLRFESSTPAAKAVLEVAMDARRLGLGLSLPQAFLIDAAIDYFSEHDFEQLTEDWAEAAFAELARPVHGKQAPLNRTGSRPKRRSPSQRTASGSPGSAAGPMFRLADYLEQHGRAMRRRLCPPASFWDAAYTHVTRVDELKNLMEAAKSRFRLQWAHHLEHAAKAAEQKRNLSRSRTIRRPAAGVANPTEIILQARRREQAGDIAGADVLYRSAGVRALSDLTKLRDREGDREGAEAAARSAAKAGNTSVLCWLAHMREKAGDRASANALRQEAANAGNPFALSDLARKLEREGDPNGAESLAHRAANAGDGYALRDIVRKRERAGDRQGAEGLADRAAAVGVTEPMRDLAEMREGAGNRESADSLARRAALAGDLLALRRLANMRQTAGDLRSAEHLYGQAAGHGDDYSLLELARIRERFGDREIAEQYYRLAADAGALFGKDTRDLTRLWPYGLDPDGTPTPVWG
ncbi:hypothetical protein [Streptomyces sp. NPDC047043]|uniref:hypothetical protein n=1 Tax=Streptomyces sp. NPDC047043 TaxID=3154497 RepID=UPI0033E4A04F